MNRSPLYLFLGPESGDKQREIRAIRDQLAKTLGGDLDEHTFYGFEDTVGQAVSLARNGSLFAAGVFIVFRCAEQLKGTEDTKPLESFAANPFGSAVIVFESDETSAAKSAFLKKAAEIVPKHAQKTFWGMFENQRQSWLVNYVKNQGGEISREAAELFLDLVENNSSDMAQECDKLLLLHAGKKEIAVEDIETFVFHSKEENQYTLFSYLAEKDFGLALEGLQKIFSTGDGNGIGIMSSLLWQFRNLALIKSEFPHGIPQIDFLKKIGIGYKRSQTIYLTAAQRYSAIEAARILRLAGQYEFALRDFRASYHAYLLELFCYQAIIRGGKGSILDGGVTEEPDGFGILGLRAD